MQVALPTRSLVADRLVEALPDGIALVDHHGSMQHVNGRLETLAGYRPGELIGRAVEILVPPSHRATHVDRRQQFARDPSDRAMGAGLDLTLVRRDGTELPVDIALSSLDLDGVPYVVVAVRDDSGRREAVRARIDAEQRVALAERRFRTAFEHSAVGMALVGLDGSILQANRRICALTGAQPAALVGSNVASIVHHDDVGILQEVKHRLEVEGLGHLDVPLRILPDEGPPVWTEASVSLVQGDRHHARHFVVSLRDVTDERSLQAQLTYQALHDPLTGLGNRALFKERLDHAMAGGGRAGTVAVLVMDLDEFKQVNDTFGHGVGDEVLRAVAARLSSVARATDTVCRLGGDEFLLLAEGLRTPDEAGDIAERVLRSLEDPIPIAGGRLVQRASIGVVICDGGDCNALVDAADRAMYKAKRLGTGHYVVTESG